MYEFIATDLAWVSRQAVWLDFDLRSYTMPRPVKVVRKKAIDKILRQTYRESRRERKNRHKTVDGKGSDASAARSKMMLMFVCA